MTKKAKLPESIKDYDFAKLAKREKQGNARVRLLALSHLKTGKSCTETAEIVKVTKQGLNNWIRRFEREGLAGLYDKPKSGARRKVESHQEEAFKKALSKLEKNHKGGRIRGKDILKLLKKEFKIKCTLNTVYHTLARLNFVWITGRSQHPKANIEAQETFKKTLGKW